MGWIYLKWYAECFKNETITNAFVTTIQITLAAAIISTLLGTLAAIGISAMKKKNKAIMLGATNIPLLNADIVTGIAMMLLFVKFMNLGFVTVLIAHITFDIPYVILNVLPKLNQANRYTYEAALDLGATPLYAFFRITWPEIKSGVFSGFNGSHHVAGRFFDHLLYKRCGRQHTLYHALHRAPEGDPPGIICFIDHFIFDRLPAPSRDEPPFFLRGKRCKTGNLGGSYEKRLAMLFALCLMTGVLSSCGKDTGSTETTKKDDNTLVILNYGKYIDESVLDQFEKETGIKVKLEEYESPEEMYTKFSAGSINYDLVCTSDYMVERLINEDQVLEINFDDFEYYKNLDSSIIEASQIFDPENKYSMPYFYGTLGILYNTTMVSDEEVSTWNVLWDEAYKDSIIMQNSVRDSFTPALRLLGYDINTTDENQLNDALDLLIRQKPLVYAYYVDETGDEMAMGNAAMALVYSGEAAYAMELNDDLSYSVPEEGSNLWIDSWFMPKSCHNTEYAEKFLDFLCREDIGMLNFDYVYYATPNLAVKENLDEETLSDTTIFPTDETLANCEVYKQYDIDTTKLSNYLWKN